MDAKKVVIIGGGFGGINLAQKLSRNKSFQIVLVDKNNYNFFPPLLYQLDSRLSYKGPVTPFYP